MRRSHAVTLFLSAAVVVAFASPAVATATTTSGARTTAHASSSSIGFDDPLCVSRSSLCADAYDNPGSEYVGHDEPSVLFKSGVRGSGNDLTYTVTLPDGRGFLTMDAAENPPVLDQILAILNELVGEVR